MDNPLRSFMLQRGSEHLIKREEQRKTDPGFHLPLALGGHWTGRTHGDSLQWHKMETGMTDWRLCGCLLTGRIWKVIVKKEDSTPNMPFVMLSAMSSSLHIEHYSSIETHLTPWQLYKQKECMRGLSSQIHANGNKCCCVSTSNISS